MSAGRNGPCSCGSGKKYKHCCAKTAAPRPVAAVDFSQLVTLYSRGHHSELESRARALLEEYPNSGFCWKALGLSLQMQDKDALAALRKAAQLLPDDAEAHNNLGNALKDNGQLDAALKSYQGALKINPDYALAHNNVGTILEDLGQLDDAATSYRRALAIEPEFAEVHNNLGNVLQILGHHASAAESCRRALRIDPDFAEAHNNLGNALKDLDQTDAAIASYRQSIRINPRNAEVHSNLGAALQSLGQFDSSMESLRAALDIDASCAFAHNNLGNALRELGHQSAAMASFQRALEIQPDYVDACHNLGIVLLDIGHFTAAVACFRQALKIKPEYAEAHNSLGNALKDLGHTDEAVASFRNALAIKPSFASAHSNLLYTLNYSTSYTPTYCLEEARRYGQIASEKVIKAFSKWGCVAEPERLRVGLVSGDLRNHPVGYFLENLLNELDPNSVELIAYPTHHQTDELTARIKSHFVAWRPLVALSDEVAAKLIHADGVHVLLDLSGHTAKNRLPIFAWKAAPVQASWLGYFATTGIAEMDFFLADDVAAREAERQHFVEGIWNLPDTRLCFTPPPIDVSVACLPAIKNGYITFGCFQNLAKVGNSVLRAWGMILAAMPTALFRWQCKQFGDSTIARQVVERLNEHGIDPACVTLHGLVSRKDYLSAYAEVDVILDTFPFTGGTTTCEALWMGVPTLSIAGATLVARQGASLLTAIGLADWIVSNEVDYVESAIRLTRDLRKLENLRAGLRAQLMGSPVCDAPRFAKNFEAALWGMWQAKK